MDFLTTTDRRSSRDNYMDYIYQRDHLSCDILNQITERSVKKIYVNKHKEAISQYLKPHKPDTLRIQMCIQVRIMCHQSPMS